MLLGLLALVLMFLAGIGGLAGPPRDQSDDATNPRWYARFDVATENYRLRPGEDSLSRIRRTAVESVALAGAN
jgi:hypothetical protein